MLKELFEQERQYLNSFFDRLDIEAAEKVLEKLYQCEGMIVLTGVGKSGIVAKKIAVTLTSTGSRAIYLSPTDALHGDIGILTERDVFIMLSKSGESDELLEIVPFLRNRNVPMIAVVSKQNSRLAKAAEMAIELPIAKELCPFDMVPTTSAVAQMIFGDVVAIALMKRKNFSLDQYARNHPAGRIGKQINMKVKDLMICGDGIPTCRPSDKLVNTLVELSDKRCGCLLVTDEQQQLQGIFTDGDLRRALQNEGGKVLDLTVGQLMNPTARHIGPNAPAMQAMQAMESDQKHPITILPVINDNKQVVGLVKMHDLVQSGL